MNNLWVLNNDNALSDRDSVETEFKITYIAVDDLDPCQQLQCLTVLKNDRLLSWYGHIYICKRW